jgi:AcrR family transcriptional regulator
MAPNTPPRSATGTTATLSGPVSTSKDGAAGANWGGYPKGRARREAIIRVAAEHFGQRGFGNATIRDIAAACRISRAGLVHYFPDKEALLQAVLEDRDIQDRNRFGPYVGIPGGMGILRGTVDLADHNRLVPGLIELFARLSTEASASDHPAHRYFSERYTRIRNGTADALRAAQAAGYLRADLQPEMLATRLTALMDGLQAQWLFDRRIDLAAQMQAAVTEMLTDSGRRAFEAAEPA